MELKNLLFYSYKTSYGKLYKKMCGVKKFRILKIVEFKKVELSSMKNPEKCGIKLCGIRKMRKTIVKRLKTH